MRKRLIYLTLILMILLTLPLMANAQEERLTIVSGNNQKGEVSTQLASPFTVKYETKPSGGDWGVVAGKTIYFRVLLGSSASSSASLSAGTATTDANGEASVTLTLGRLPGTYTVAALTKENFGASTKTASFTAEAFKITLESVSGNSQSATVGRTLANPFVVKLTNQVGELWASQTVTFAITGKPTGSTGASLSATTQTTGTNGQTSTTLTLGDTAGTYTVTASFTKPDNTQETTTFTATANAKVATTLEKRSVDGQTVTGGSKLSTAFIVRVLDQDDAPMSGVSVSFSVSPSSGSVNRPTMTTGSNGQASTVLTVGTDAGTYTVTASVAGITETVTFTATVKAPPTATKLEKRSGDGQSVQVGTQLTNAFIVRVLDQYGAAMGGVSVSFSVSPSSGSINRPTMITGDNGQASTTLTVGNTPGTYTVTASVAGITETVTFTATAEAAPTATTLEKRSGDGQSARVGTQLTSAFIVRVLDQYGAPLSGVSVSFSVSPSSGSINRPTMTTGNNGQASTTLTVGNTAGTYTVTASITKADNTKETVTFTATATAVPVTKSATTLQKVSGDGQSAQVNTQLSNAFVVRVLDQNGTAMSDVSVSFSVSPSGSLSATTATTNSNGQASTRLTFGNTTGTYTVTARAAGISSTVSFTATAEAAPPPPPPERIATTLESVSGRGQSAQVNTQLSSAFVVRVLDQDGAALGGISVSFSVSPSGTLSASTATTGTNGQASTILTFGSTTGTYTVTASVAGITETVSFTATAEAAPPPTAIRENSNNVGVCQWEWAIRRGQHAAE